MSGADPQSPVGEDVEVVAESSRYLVTGDTEGFAIWDLQGDVEAPVADFPPGIDGQDDAIESFERLNGLVRRGRILTVLAWLAAIVGGLWLLYSAVFVVASVIILVEGDLDEANEALVGRLFGLSMPVTVLPNAFFVSVGLYVVVWMQLRSRRDGD